mgnify:CR=1 FL=1
MDTKFYSFYSARFLLILRIYQQQLIRVIRFLFLVKSSQIYQRAVTKVNNLDFVRLLNNDRKMKHLIKLECSIRKQATNTKNEYVDS